jgi:hypothetical protein
LGVVSEIQFCAAQILTVQRVIRSTIVFFIATVVIDTGLLNDEFSSDDETCWFAVGENKGSSAGHFHLIQAGDFLLQNSLQ